MEPKRRAGHAAPGGPWKPRLAARHIDVIAFGAELDERTHGLLLEEGVFVAPAGQFFQPTVRSDLPGERTILDEVLVMHRSGERFFQRPLMAEIRDLAFSDDLYLADAGWVSEAMCRLISAEIADNLHAAQLINYVFNALRLYDVRILPNVIAAMRLGRYLAQLELEERPFATGLAIGAAEEPPGRRLYDLRARRVYAGIGSATELRAVGELAQGSAALIYAGVRDGIVRGIYETAAARGEEKLKHFTQLAAEMKAILYCLPGNGTVEMYTRFGQLLKHDGFSWKPHLYLLGWSLRGVLGILLGWEFDAERLMEAVEILSTERLASIIVVDPDDYTQPSKEEAGQVKLVPLRSEGPPESTIDTLRIGTLVSIFRLDGAHFISRTGKLVKIAQRVEAVGSLEREEEALAGTGRRAAQLLSRAFPRAVVIKVSGSNGTIAVHHGGVQQSLRRAGWRLQLE